MAVLKRPPRGMTSSKRQEKKTAREFGGRRTQGSGNKWHDKGDVKTPKFLIECKTTDAASYRLDKATIQKIQIEAAMAGKEPVLRIDIQGLELAVIPVYLFKNLTTKDDEDATDTEKDPGSEDEGRGTEGGDRGPDRPRGR